MHPVLCTNTHHDVTDLVNHGIVKNTKIWISWKQNITFLRNKKFLNLCLKWHSLRTYRFLVGVTFKPCNGFKFSHSLAPLATSTSHFVHSSLVYQMYAKEMHFCSFATNPRVQSRMYQIYTHICSTVSIGLPYMENPTRVSQDLPSVGVSLHFTIEPLPPSA